MDRMPEVYTFTTIIVPPIPASRVNRIKNWCQGKPAVWTWTHFGLRRTGITHEQEFVRLEPHKIQGQIKMSAFWAAGHKEEVEVLHRIIAGTDSATDPQHDSPV